MATKPKIAELHKLFCDLTRKCEQWREWDELLAVAEEGERCHRRMGKRFTDGAAKYRQSVRVAVEYFACKCVLEPIKLPDNWADIAGYRRDYQLGQGLRSRLLGKEQDALTALDTRWRALGFDYSPDIVGRP